MKKELIVCAACAPVGSFDRSLGFLSAMRLAPNGALALPPLQR